MRNNSVQQCTEDSWLNPVDAIQDLLLFHVAFNPLQIDDYGPLGQIRPLDE